MLISIMYHHINSDKYSNNNDVFEKHLNHISKNFNSTFPTSTPPKKAVCLVFDDGYYDFYKFVFPLLKKYKVKALLAIIPKYILGDTDKEDHQRLNKKHDELFKHYKEGTFCTYKELKEMHDSGLVQIVSHSYSHVNLLDDHVDVTEELQKSKQILEEKLTIQIDSFVYPFGKYNQDILDETMVNSTPKCNT